MGNGLKVLALGGGSYMETRRCVCGSYPGVERDHYEQRIRIVCENCGRRTEWVLKRDVKLSAGTIADMWNEGLDAAEGETPW